MLLIGFCYHQSGLYFISYLDLFLIKSLSIAPSHDNRHCVCSSVLGHSLSIQFNNFMFTATEMRILSEFFIPLPTCATFLHASSSH